MIKKAFMPKITSAVPRTKSKIIEGIIKYIDRNHDILQTPKMLNRPSFSDDDRDIIFANLELLPSEIDAVVKNSTGIQANRKVSANPFYIACTLLASYAATKKEDEFAVLVLTFMSINMYSSLHFKYAKFNANENVMNYTISQLDDSYSIKKLGTLYALLKDNVETAYKTYKKQLMRAEDKDIGDFINAVLTRTNNKIKKIFNNYYKHYQSKKYLNIDTEAIIPDEYKEITNDFHAMTSLADKVFINFINGRMNKEILKYSIVNTEVSEVKFMTLLKDIIDGTTDMSLRRFIVNLIGYAVYYNRMPMQEVRTGKYLNLMMTAYSSNTESREMKEIKEQLDEWIQMNATKYGYMKYGKTAANSYRRALYRFFIYTVYHEAK
jgi:hypothetical protein